MELELEPLDAAGIAAAIGDRVDQGTGIAGPGPYGLAVRIVPCRIVGYGRYEQCGRAPAARYQPPLPKGEIVFRR